MQALQSRESTVALDTLSSGQGKSRNDLKKSEEWVIDRSIESREPPRPGVLKMRLSS